MGFIAKNNANGDFKRVPKGVFIGRCYSLIDLGTQITVGQYGTKSQHKIRISWELFGEDENGASLTVDVDGSAMPMTISKSYTVSLHEKSGLRRDLASWRGKDFTEEEAQSFDVSKLLGAYCMINVTESENNGKVYSNVGGITPLPGALKNSKPTPVHENVIFDLDQPDLKIFNRFHEKLQDVIKKSPEWAKHATDNKSHDNNDSSFDANEDIPF